MKEFKGTKGKWSVFKNLEEFAITTIDETQAICFMPALYTDSEANAKLIASAPEMFEMLKQAKTTICRLRLSISIHPDCEENSEFADYVDLADEKEKQIKQLLTKITE